MIEGAQIHLRHRRIGVTMTMVMLVEEGTLSGGFQCGWRRVRKSQAVERDRYGKEPLVG